MRIKKADWLDWLIILSMFLQLVVLGFFGLNPLMNKVVTALIFFRIALDSFNVPKRGFLLSCLVLMLFVCSSMVGNLSASTILSNFLIILYPMAYTYYGYYICMKKADFVDNILARGALPVNIVMLVNTFAMLSQIFFPYSIQAKIIMSEITFYPDTISGFFAYASTHVAGLFCIFVVLYNISYCRDCAGKRKKTVIVYTVILMAVNCFISLKNDNKAFFLILPMYLVTYYLLDDSRLYVKMKKIAHYGCALAISGVAVYLTVPPFSEFFNESIYGLVTSFLENYHAGTSAVGSNERIAQVGYALNLPATWLFGHGIGSNGLHEPGFHGFKHFGQASMGGMMLLLGVWYFIALFSWYAYLNILIMKERSRRPLPRLFVCTFVFTSLALTLYLQWFSNVNIAYCIMLIAFALRIKVQKLTKAQSIPGL